MGNEDDFGQPVPHSSAHVGPPYPGWVSPLLPGAHTAAGCSPKRFTRNTWVGFFFFLSKTKFAPTRMQEEKEVLKVELFFFFFLLCYFLKRNIILVNVLK